MNRKKKLLIFLVKGKTVVTNSHRHIFKLIFDFLFKSSHKYIFAVGLNIKISKNFPNFSETTWKISFSYNNRSVEIFDEFWKRKEKSSLFKLRIFEWRNMPETWYWSPFARNAGVFFMNNRPSKMLVCNWNDRRVNWFYLKKIVSNGKKFDAFQGK